MKHRTLAVYWLVVAATLWAAFSRFHHLFSLPPQAWVDEIWFALRAREFWQTGQFHLFYKTFWGGVHPLFVYLTAAAQALGFDKVIVASRAVSAVSGVLSVPLAFACFDELWRDVWPAPVRRLVAALAALILSNLLYTVVVSRVGTEPAVALAMGLVCVWQMRRAERTGQWSSWVGAGLVAGVAQYLSPHARFILPVLGLMALHDLIRRRADRRRALFFGFGLMGLAALLAALPLTLFFVREPEWFLARARAVTAIPTQTGPRFLLDNLRRILLSLNLRGDLNPRHNLPGRPLFDGIQSVGFWIGVGWATTRFHRSAPARELLVWAGIMITPSLITDEAPQFERMIGLAAPAAALIAIGWMLVWAWLGRRLEPTQTVEHGVGVVMPAMAWLLILASLTLNAFDYFVRYPHALGLAEAFTATPVRLARELIARAQTETVFVERITEAEDVFAFDFLFPGTPVRRLDFRQCLPFTEGRATQTTYLVLSERDHESVGRLEDAFPTVTITRLQPEAAALMGEATLIEIPPGSPAPAPMRTARARFDPGLAMLGYDWSGPEIKAGESLFLTLYWKAETNFTTDLTAFLHVGRGEGDSPLAGQHDGQPCQGLYPTSQWRAGDVIPDSFAITFPPDTDPGEYPLVVGWYRYPSLERLPLVSADLPLANNRAVIGTVRVTTP